MNDMAQSRFADCENKLLEVDSIARTTGSVEMKLSLPANCTSSIKNGK